MLLQMKKYVITEFYRRVWNPKLSSRLFYNEDIILVYWNSWLESIGIFSTGTGNEYLVKS